MKKRNLMVSDRGGSVLVVSDTLHEKNGDYVEVARIEKKTGKIDWNIKDGLNEENMNRDNHEFFKGTIREVVQRISEVKRTTYNENK